MLLQISRLELRTVLAPSCLPMVSGRDLGAHPRPSTSMLYTSSRAVAPFGDEPPRCSCAGGQVVLLEIQATLGRPPSTAVSMMKSVYLAYVVVLLAYFPVAISGG